MYFDFDQFEELFTYNFEQINILFSEILELLSPNLPLRYRRKIDSSTEYSETDLENIEKDLKTRFIFSIRSDKLLLINQLKSYIPNVLHNIYELKALTVEEAKHAIIEPAQTKGKFITPEFTYNENIVNQLINYLDEEHSDQIETSLLQIICENIEKKYVFGQNIDKITEKLNLSYPSIVKNYYKDKLASFSLKENNKITDLFENGLVSEVPRMRLTLHESTIFHYFKIDKILLNDLVNSRLIRSEIFQRGGYSYELSHDKLLEPILKEKRNRIELKEKNDLNKKYKRQIISLLLFIIILLAALFFAVKINQNIKNKVKTEKTITELKDKRQSLEDSNKIITSNLSKLNTDLYKTQTLLYEIRDQYDSLMQISEHISALNQLSNIIKNGAGPGLSKNEELKNIKEIYVKAYNSDSLDPKLSTIKENLKSLNLWKK
ncbi:MAG: hypothetical protein IPL55_00260 [Saprospiraceae bacterium]|nr:hypothetical protein [Saprospiraceae bacterium]